MKITKFPLNLHAATEIKLPLDATILTVHLESGRLVVFVRVPKNAAPVSRMFVAREGDKEYEESSDETYLGTVTPSGRHYHVFERAV